MPTLSSTRKQQLLSQVQKGNRGNDIVKQVVSLLQNYDNLSKEDFAPPVLEQDTYDQLIEQLHDPHELQAWNQLRNAPRGTKADLKHLLGKIESYISEYQTTEYAHATQAAALRDDVERRIEEMEENERVVKERERERETWEKLDRNSYTALIRYLERYPNSVHRGEIDDLMWKSLTGSGAIKMEKIQRYIDDMPSGKHVWEARNAVDNYEGWNEIKSKGDIVAVKQYIDNNNDSPFLREAKNRFYTLQDEELENMRNNPSEYSFDRLRDIFDAGVFSIDDLIEKGLITERSWDILTDPETKASLPELSMDGKPVIVKAREGCTDIFLFGTPSTGKTCLLMGLAGANGAGYSLNMVGPGGQYISDITIYADKGITPSRTGGNFVTVINGYINEQDKKGNVIRHPVNLVEMSGEEFAMKIAQNPKNTVSFDNMGTGATTLLSNDNRKVFFIIVDPTKVMVPFDYYAEETDEDGKRYVVGQKRTYISQKIILAKLASLFANPLNAKIMEKVDAIHFIVTKADTLGEMQNERNVEAAKRLAENYAAAMGQMSDYIKRTRRINASSDHEMYAFTFSLGKFYLGDVFELDKTDTLRIIEAIKEVTFGNRELTTWDRIKNVLNYRII